MSRHFALGLTVIALACLSCRPAGPTRPTEVDIGGAVEATLTALAPTATQTPKPTATTRPSATPSPTATPIPVVVPEGWIAYEAITGEFTLAHPPSWTVSDETPTAAYFKVPNFALFGAGVSDPECNYGSDQEDTASLDCFVTLVAEYLGEEDAFRLINKGTWGNGTYSGYVIEATTYDNIYEQYSYHLRVFIPLQDILLHASYFRAGTKSITDSEREAFTTAVRSIRVKQGQRPNTASIYARDEQGELLPGGIVNVWDDYETRSRVVTTCKDGEIVAVIRRSGDGVLIETQAGQRGWVSRWFLTD